MSTATAQSRFLLFPKCLCFVTGDPQSAGFHELYLPDGFRLMDAQAVCRCPVIGETASAQPCVMVRANPTNVHRGAYLSLSVDGRHIGTQLVHNYGTYFYPVSQDVLAERMEDESVEIHLGTLSTPALTSPGKVCQISIYEIQIISLADDNFPERQLLFGQTKILQSGTESEMLTTYPFRSTDRILDVGAGMGWTTVLLAGLSGASAIAVDTREYAQHDGVNFKTELLERFDRHRDALARIPAVACLAKPEVLEQVIQRCTFLTMSAEEMLLPDNCIDFVYSLNAFEHIPRPDRAIAEVRRVLCPGGHALLQFSPLYYSDSGSHLPMTVEYKRPWSHLLMTRDEIKQTIVDSGGCINEVDSILDSLNGWTPAQFIEAFEGSGLRVLFSNVQTGFTLEGAEQSPEFAELLQRHSRQELTTISMLWFLEKPVV